MAIKLLAFRLLINKLTPRLVQLNYLTCLILIIFIDQCSHKLAVLSCSKPVELSKYMYEGQQGSRAYLITYVHYTATALV